MTQEKQTKTTYAPPSYVRGLPDSLVNFFEQDHKVVRLMSSHSQSISMVASQDCHPIGLEDLPDEKTMAEARKQILTDLASNGFRQVDGAFHRGDTMLFHQQVAAREFFRQEAKRIFASQGGDDDYVEEQVEGWNEEIHNAGFAGSGVDLKQSSVPPLSAHATGGASLRDRIGLED